MIGIGAWLGTIMLLNVWGVIWPNQKKILGIVPATRRGESARARKTAGLASRMNFVLSIPMLLCMGAASHGLPFSSSLPELPAGSRHPGRGGARRGHRPRATSPPQLVPAAQRVRGRVITREAAVLCRACLGR